MGSLLNELNKAYKILGVKPGLYIRFRYKSEILEGVVMPPYVFTDPDIIVVKLKNGYNIGVLYSEIKDLEIIEMKKPEASSISSEKIVQRKDLPKIIVVGTGGTIASKIEYETGAVKPSTSVDELIEAIPEVLDIAYIESETLFNILSENMRPEYWEIIAERIYNYMRDETYKGVIVTHGTDTMSFTASAIAFAIQRKNIPIVFVGSQRSSDRPSSDAALNFIGAVITAVKAPFAESVIAMHHETSDTKIAVSRGVKTRKMHTSRRDTFRSINARPLALVDPFKKDMELIEKEYIPRSKEEPILMNGFDKKVALIYSYPGIDPEILEFLIEKKYRGIVIAGTGFGHVPEYMIPVIRKAINNNIAVAVTSQTLYGRVNLSVYQTGREMLRAGVIPCEDMLPETAYVKLSWTLYRTDNIESVRKIMLTNYVYEMNPRLTEDLFLR
ncbi:MAG: Glu-tRNA(Gln) amidotransferase subunit GatD [Desulfurococcaceae archaeon]|nr:Glu-tRNA(Gln) amidotransferase subunit GatD [Desulfurococcaceae archaeon]